MKQFFAQKAFIIHNGKLLCVQRSMDDLHIPGKWETPGGRMEFGETIDEHIKREVFEEVGLEIETIRPFYLWQWVLDKSEEPRQIIAAAVLAVAKTLDISYEHREDDDCLGEAKWVDFNDLKSVDWAPDVIPVIEAFLALPEIIDLN